MSDDSVAERVAAAGTYMPYMLTHLNEACATGVAWGKRVALEAVEDAISTLTADNAAKDRLITALTEDNAKLANACDAKDDRIAELERLVGGADAMLDAIERVIPRNEAHRDYSETVQLFVEEAAVASARKQHGGSGMCCTLREQERRRADELQAKLTAALSSTNFAALSADIASGNVVDVRTDEPLIQPTSQSDTPKSAK